MDVWHFVPSHSELNIDKSIVAMVIGSFYSYGSLNVSIFNKRIAKQIV